jgi:NAD(P)-dependent dehydrogenase (short-subunit alcohol dehydrogenase family)
MPSTSPVILILGAGPNIGQHVARAFASKGYKVALAARRAREVDNTADQINITGDLSDPNDVVNVFQKAKALLGTPSVVVYNGKTAH